MDGFCNGFEVGGNVEGVQAVHRGGGAGFDAAREFGEFLVLFVDPVEGLPVAALGADEGDGVFVVAVPRDSGFAARECDFVAQLRNVRRPDAGKASIGVAAENGAQVRRLSSPVSLGHEGCDSFGCAHDVQNQVDEDNGHLLKGQQGRVSDVIPPVVRRETVRGGAANRCLDGVQRANISGVQTLLEMGNGRVPAEVMAGHIGEVFFVRKPHHFRGLRAARRNRHVDENMLPVDRADPEVVVMARVGCGDDHTVHVGIASQFFDT